MTKPPPRPSRTYAVPDLHGRADLLGMALDAVAARGGGTVVFTGDYVDRGPASRQVIGRLMAGPPAGQRWICLKGNHEDMMTEAAADPSTLPYWFRNGGDATLRSYVRDPGDRASLAILPAEHLEWIRALPLLHVDAHRVYVHAAVDPALPLDSQVADTLLWHRHGPGEDGGHGGRHVVHGHTPHVHGPICLRGRTDLDTLAWSTGRLVVGAFDDAQPGGPMELIELQGAPYAG